MKRIFFIFLMLICAFLSVSAQIQKVQNRPYTDLRPFHFGIQVGAHLQDMEFVNVGPQTIVNEDGTTTDVLILTDQDSWDPGFTVGVLGEFRLNTNFQLRVAPTMYFGSRHLTMLNMGNPDAPQEVARQKQDMKTIYVGVPVDMIFAAPRFNNHRPYIMAGVSPMLNLSGSRDDYYRMNSFDVFAEVGIGCDFYLPFFKLRPELKFMYGLTNCLDKSHSKEIRDANMLPYVNAVSEAHSKIIALTFYFE